jgi:hypothetical protein
MEPESVTPGGLTVATYKQSRGRVPSTSPSDRNHLWAVWPAIPVLERLPSHVGPRLWRWG